MAGRIRFSTLTEVFMFKRGSTFTRMSTGTAVLISVVITSLPVTAFADEMAADEAAKELANPAGSLASFANNFTYRMFKGDLPGADDQDVWAYTLQPVLPFPVGDKGRRIIVRPAFTVSFDQPIFDANQGRFTNLGTEFNDVTFDTVYAGNTMKTKQIGYLWGMGVAGTLPTASDKELGGDQWRLGPELFGGIIREWGVMGALVNNQFNIGGSGDSYSTTTAQYFYGITLGNGWQILSAPVLSYDWKASSDEAWTIPIGTGIAKTTKIGKTTWRFQFEVQYYVKQPDPFGSEWLVSFEARPVIKNPLLKWFR
jgi:hypothetical protein